LEAKELVQPSKGMKAAKSQGGKFSGEEIVVKPFYWNPQHLARDEE